MMPTSTSQSPRIEHVVVLMLENRSFDHMLGFLDHPNPAFDGIQPGSHHNDDSHGAHIPATDEGVPRGLDPEHSHEGALRQLGPFGDVPQNGGFVQDYELRVSNEAKARPDDLPFTLSDTIIDLPYALNQRGAGSGALQPQTGIFLSVRAQNRRIAG